MKVVGARFLEKKKRMIMKALWPSAGVPALFFVLTFSSSFCRQLFLNMLLGLCSCAVVWYFSTANLGDCTIANLSLRFL